MHKLSKVIRYTNSTLQYDINRSHVALLYTINSNPHAAFRSLIARVPSVPTPRGFPQLSVKQFVTYYVKGHHYLRIY